VFCPECKNEIDLEEGDEPDVEENHGGSVGDEQISDSDILFKCAKCGKRIAIGSAGVGKSFACPDCQAPIFISEPTTAFQCPSCTWDLASFEDCVGEVFDCPNCEKQVQVPSIVVSESAKPKLRLQKREEGKVVHQRASLYDAAYGIERKDDSGACPHCGNPLPSTAVFCVNCGTDLRTGTPLATGVSGNNGGAFGVPPKYVALKASEIAAILGGLFIFFVGIGMQNLHWWWLLLLPILGGVTAHLFRQALFPEVCEAERAAVAEKKRRKQIERQEALANLFSPLTIGGSILFLVFMWNTGQLDGCKRVLSDSHESSEQATADRGGDIEISCPRCSKKIWKYTTCGNCKAVHSFKRFVYPYCLNCNTYFKDDYYCADCLVTVKGIDEKHVRIVAP